MPEKMVNTKEAAEYLGMKEKQRADENTAR
jgi:hypothetical protein